MPKRTFDGENCENVSTAQLLPGCILRFIMSFMLDNARVVSLLRSVNKHWAYALSADQIEKEGGLEYVCSPFQYHDINLLSLVGWRTTRACVNTLDMVWALLDRSAFLIEFDPAGAYDYIQDDLIILASIRFQRLTKLDVSYCELITDEAIIAITRRCRGLVDIDVWLCCNLTDRSILSIAQGCPGLKKLNMRVNSKYTDAAVEAVAVGCPGLTHLDISSCRSLTNASLYAIAANCKNLEEICTSYSPGFTTAAIDAMVLSCPKLTRVYRT